ncbi:hypothetical protein HDU96_009710 [Phlyctochytrium bullatum]|nr:hypothetical protein HDU96_009710 [Phlyctochytrium bullatum]
MGSEEIDAKLSSEGEKPQSVQIEEEEEDIPVVNLKLDTLPQIAHIKQCEELLVTIQQAIPTLQHQRHSLSRLLERSKGLITTMTKSFTREDGGPVDDTNATAPSGWVIPPHVKTHLESVVAMLISVEEFVQKQSIQKFMQRFVNRQNVEARLLCFHQELATISQDLSMGDLRQWREEDREDRAADLSELEITLQHLVDNDYKILNALELKQQEYLEAMEALQKNLTEHVDRSLERNLERLFMEKALAQLRRVSQNVQAPTVHDWVITSWEVEIGETIAKGGFGEVARGTWLGHTQVAVKRLFVRLDTNRLKEDFLREVKAWYPLRHPHVLPLLGACATAERPFMVSPYMSNGHALQYLDRYPNDHVRKMKLLYEVSQGMQYLHSRRVIHGDLKAINILVDENGRAFVADFGFAYLKKVTSTRQTSTGSLVAGTLRWMAPERLLGGPPTAAVDVYAFAMTCYEVVTEGDIPQSNIPDSLIYQAVVNNNSRPSRPDECTSNVLWDLITQCWHPDPLQRPSFATVSVTTKSVLAEVEVKIAAAATSSAGTPPPPVTDSLKTQEVDVTLAASGVAAAAAAPAQPADAPVKPVAAPVGPPPGPPPPEEVDAVEAPKAAADVPPTPVEKDVPVMLRLNDASLIPATEEAQIQEALNRSLEGMRLQTPQNGLMEVEAHDSGFGSMASSRNRQGNSSFSTASDEFFRLHFEDGSPGDFVSKLADGMPLKIQSELHRKMAEFGKAVSSGSVNVGGTPELQHFAKDLERAATLSAEINTRRLMSSSSATSAHSVEAGPSTSSGQFPDGGDLSGFSDGEFDSDPEMSANGGDALADDAADAESSGRHRHHRRRERARARENWGHHRHHRGFGNKFGGAPFPNGVQTDTQPQQPQQPQQSQPQPSARKTGGGGGLLANLMGMFSTQQSLQAPSQPAGAPAFRPPSQASSSFPHDSSSGRGGFGSRGDAGPVRPSQVRPPPPPRPTVSSALARRIPNPDARDFWHHYWGPTTFEVTLSDFLSCLEERLRTAVNRHAVRRIVKPVDGPRGEKMVSTAGLNNLVGDAPNLNEAVRRINDMKPTADDLADATAAVPTRNALSSSHQVPRQGSLPPGFPSYYGDAWEPNTRSQTYQSAGPPPMYVTREMPAQLGTSPLGRSSSEGSRMNPEYAAAYYAATQAQMAAQMANSGHHNPHLHHHHHLHHPAHAAAQGFAPMAPSVPYIPPNSQVFVSPRPPAPPPAGPAAPRPPGGPRAPPPGVAGPREFSPELSDVPPPVPLSWDADENRF